VPTIWPLDSALTDTSLISFDLVTDAGSCGTAISIVAAPSSPALIEYVSAPFFTVQPFGTVAVSLISCVAFVGFRSHIGISRTPPEATAIYGTSNFGNRSKPWANRKSR
jgi:hypothetical protein